MAKSKLEEMIEQVGKIRHQDCSNCKTKKAEHIFIKKNAGFFSSSSYIFGWQCLNCGYLHEVYRY
jgi:hypothetical protein